MGELLLKCWGGHFIDNIWGVLGEYVDFVPQIAHIFSVHKFFTHDERWRACARARSRSPCWRQEWFAFESCWDDAEKKGEMDGWEVVHMPSSFYSRSQTDFLCHFLTQFLTFWFGKLLRVLKRSLFPQYCRGDLKCFFDRIFNQFLNHLLNRHPESCEAGSLATKKVESVWVPLREDLAQHFEVAHRAMLYGPWGQDVQKAVLPRTAASVTYIHATMNWVSYVRH